MLYVRSISVDFEGLDAALSQASGLQQGTVFTDLHVLAAEAVSLKHLQSVVLTVLGRRSTSIEVQYKYLVIGLEWIFGRVSALEYFFFPGTF